MTRARRLVGLWLLAPLAAALALGVYAFWIEPRALRVERLTYSVEGLAAPVRVVAIGDPQPNRLHWSPERLAAAFDRAAAEKPDLVLWLGDYAYEPSRFFALFGLADWAFVEPSDTVAAMARLDAPMGAYAVLGNHDWWWNGPEIARLLREAGIRVLIDEAVLAAHPETGARLGVVGLDDISAPRPVDLERALAAAPEDAPLLILTHSPDMFGPIAARDPDRVALTLAGHTHGGQIVLPWFGPLASVTADRRFVHGAYDLGRQRFYVTAGIGTSVVPARLGARPEITVIDLVPSAETP